MSSELDKYIDKLHPQPVTAAEAVARSRGTRGSGRLSDFISTLHLSTSELETRLLLVRCRARRLEALYDALPRDLPPQADAALVELVDALAEKEGM